MCCRWQQGRFECYVHELPNFVRRVFCARLFKLVAPVYRMRQRRQLQLGTTTTHDAASEAAAHAKDIQQLEEDAHRKTCFQRSQDFFHDLSKKHLPTKGPKRPMNRNSFKSCIEYSFQFMKDALKDLDRYRAKLDLSSKRNCSKCYSEFIFFPHQLATCMQAIQLQRGRSSVHFSHGCNAGACNMDGS